MIPNWLKREIEVLVEGVRTRSNNATLNALLGVPDDVSGSLGDRLGFGAVSPFTATENLKDILGDLTTTKNLGGILGAFDTTQNLKAILGDLATTKRLGQILGTLDETNTLKAILGAYTAAAPLKTDVDAILADTVQIADGTLPASPTAGSLASFIASGGTALGTPLPASKSLYDVIALDRLDHATYGLSALNTDLDAILADTIMIADGALPASPVLNSLARFIASGGTALGTPLPASKSLYDGLSGGIDAVNRVAGKRQVLEKTITSAANAGDVTVATVTTQPCIIESIIIHANAAQTTDLTTCAIYGGAGKVVTLIDPAVAIQANLDAADKQVSEAFGYGIRFAATKTIVITLVGIAATAVDLTVTIVYAASVNGGYLV